MTKKSLVVVVILALLPATGFGRLGEPPRWWTRENPVVTRFLEPSSAYLAVMLPVLLCLLAVLAVLAFRARWYRGRRWAALIISGGSGVILFGVLPVVYRQFFVIYRDMEVGAPSERLWPLIGALAQVRWGGILLLLWFAIQPPIVEMLRPRSGLVRNPVMWPQELFAVAVCSAAIFGLFQPLCVLINRLGND